MTALKFNAEMRFRTAMLALFFLWPLVLFGRPSYIPDSLAYLKGGKVAVDFVITALSPEPEFSAPERSAPNSRQALSSDNQIENVRGARSAWYSVAAYLLRGPNNELIPLAAVQAIIAAFVIAVSSSAFGSLSRRNCLVVGVILAIGTPLPFVANLTIPDLFAGLFILCAMLLLFRFEELSTSLKMALLGIATFAVAAHASIPPLAASVILVAAAVRVIRTKSSERSSWKVMAILSVPLVAGTAMTLAAGMLAFGEASVAPKRYPLALARSVADGPARWYLKEECKRPSYAVCEVFGTSFPTSVSGFAFDGLKEATPRQMDRIRAEEAEIVLKAAIRYPLTEIGNFGVGLIKQLAFFHNNYATFNQKVAIDSSGIPVLKPLLSTVPALFSATDVLSYFVVALAVVWLIVHFRSLDMRDRDMIVILALALLANAAIVAFFSGVSPRYEARVIWILPLVAFSFYCSNSSARRRRNEELP